MNNVSLVRIFHWHVAKAVRSGSIQIPSSTRIAPSFQVAWKLFIDGPSPCTSCSLYTHTRVRRELVSLRIRGGDIPHRQRWRDTHRPRYCCLPITSDNGSISGSGAEIVPPSVTGMAHAADVFERNAISAITKVEAGNWTDPLSVICTRYNAFGGFSLLFLSFSKI